jgi:hypothetical protein
VIILLAAFGLMALAGMAVGVYSWIRWDLSQLNREGRRLRALATHLESNVTVEDYYTLQARFDQFERAYLDFWDGWKGRCLAVFGMRRGDFEA